MILGYATLKISHYFNDEDLIFRNLLFPSLYGKQKIIVSGITPKMKIKML